jgi:hypothetical protein
MKDRLVHCKLRKICKSWENCYGNSLWCVMNEKVYQAIVKEEDEKILKIILAI